MKNSEDFLRGQPGIFDAEFSGGMICKILRYIARDQVYGETFANSYPHALPLLLQTIIERQQDAYNANQASSVMRNMLKFNTCLQSVTTQHVDAIVREMRRIMTAQGIIIEQNKIFDSNRQPIEMNQSPWYGTIQSLGSCLFQCSKVPILKEKIV